MHGWEDVNKIGVRGILYENVGCNLLAQVWVH
jgi:hypothetical protein